MGEERGDLERPLVEPAEVSCADKVLRPVGRCYLAALALAVAVSLAAAYHQFVSKGFQKKGDSYQYVFPYEVLAVIAAAIASANSLHHIYQHLTANPSPWRLKTPVVIILSMVPVYAICSSVSFVSTQERMRPAMILNSLREFYECFVLVAFMQFIAEFWGGTVRLAQVLDVDSMTMKHVFPWIAGKINSRFRGCLSRIEPYENGLMDMRVFPFPRAPGSEYVAWTFLAALQYSVVMFSYTCATVLMWSLQVNHQISQDDIDFYSKILKGIKGVSNLYAMYNLLVLFEYLRESSGTGERMGKIRPISKFVCIKLIVIFSLWQEFIFSALAKMGYLPRMRGWYQEWTDEELNGQAAVNFLVCIEMLLFAQWHRYAYPHIEDWEAGLPPDAGLRRRASYRPPALLRCCVFQMADDVGYLLANRVRRQNKAIRLLHLAKIGEQLDLSDSSELHRLFGYFELDDKQEASLAQLQFLLKRSGVMSWYEAGAALENADNAGDKSGRLSYDEFIQLTKLHLNSVSER